MNTRIARVISRPLGGLSKTLDDIEWEDGDRPEARLGDYLTRPAREADARIVTGHPRYAVGVASVSGVRTKPRDVRCVCGKRPGKCDCNDPYPSGKQLGELLERMVREADAGIPAERRVRRTLQEMLPGYERQPVLVLHRPTMGMGALCGRWSCEGWDCPPSSAASASAGVAKAVA